MDSFPLQCSALVSWTMMILAAILFAVIGRVGLGMLRAYYILRVRAGLPVVLWFPKFWRMDGRRQKGSSLSRVLKRMEILDGPHGMYGTVFGTQPVLHVADPEAAALVLSQHTKRPGYDHFGGFFGRGVFTADGEEWRRKRSTVAHALFRGRALGGNSGPVDGDGEGGSGGGKSLAVLANEEMDSLSKAVEDLQQEDKEVSVEVVRLLQRHTLNLIHRFLCGGEDVCASPRKKRLLPRYLDAVTDMRMVILARSRSMWMFAWDWAYRALSPFHARETRNMVPIREFAELVLETATVGENARYPSSSSSSAAGRRSQGAEGGGLNKAADMRFGEATTSRVGFIRAEGGAGANSTPASSAALAAPKNTSLSNMAARESHKAYPNSMVDETITLLFAGQDTSAATLSWTMHLLSLPENRPYLLEVRREALAAAGHNGYIDCGQKSSLLTKDKQQQQQQQQQQRRLPMVDACIRESQRLYPVAPFVVRHLTSDLHLKDGTLLPAGALACVWIYGLHRHPSLWKSPDKFQPERWLDGDRQPAGAFIPYASGPRGCVGRPFAGVALRILLSRMCAAFDFSPVPAAAAAAAAAAATCAEASEAGLGGAAPQPEREGVEQRDRLQRKQGRGAMDGSSQEHRGGGGGGGGGGGAPREGSGGLAGTRESSGSKEMQAGFTVLPAGGIHLRLRRWG